MSFRPADFLRRGHFNGAEKPDLIILNQPIADLECFERLWKHSGYRLCADGGANRLHDMFSDDLEPHRKDFLPDIIHGDLDSLRDDVQEYYSSLGVSISKDPDQYSTDFGKAMKVVSSQYSTSCSRNIVILGALGGRVDQGLGLLHELLREQKLDPKLSLWLFNEASVSFIIPPGRNTIHTPMNEGYFTVNCGIVPIYGPATISTSGLEWDVNDWYTEMGFRISSSNHVVNSESIIIETDARVLFTIERAPELPHNDDLVTNGSRRARDQSAKALR